MPFNLLILPLLGGYIFVRFFNRTSITILRSDKDRLLIRASIAGLFLLIVSYAFTSYFQYRFPCDTETNCLYTWWKRNVPFDHAGTALLAFFLGAFGWWPLNFFFTQKKAIDWAIKEDADPLEQALKESSDSQQPLAITLTSGKVYVGIVTHQFNPATPTNNIAVFPLHSGYREKDTHGLYLTTNYAVVAQKLSAEVDDLLDRIYENDRSLTQLRAKKILTKNEVDKIDKLQSSLPGLMAEWLETQDKVNLFQVVIPVNQIASVFYFDESIFEEYFS